LREISGLATSAQEDIAKMMPSAQKLQESQMAKEKK